MRATAPAAQTWTFSTEIETVPASSSLVLGGNKFLITFSSPGILDLYRKYGPGGGDWDVVQTPAGDDVDAPANMSTFAGLIGMEAATWRLENAVAADRLTRISVIEVG